VGYPPRLFGKKIGETLYSVNLIPFGAFVKVKGEIGEEDSGGDLENYRSFSNHPIWQRMLIVLGGVISFWIVSIILLSIVSAVWGMPTSISDDRKDVLNPKVQIVEIAENSPAQEAELKVADIISGLKLPGGTFREIDKVSEVQDFVSNHKGEEVVLGIKRGNELKEISLEPRVQETQGEGSMGVALVRIALEKSSWYKAPFEGMRLTWVMTTSILNGWVMAIKDLIGVQKLPSGVDLEMRGPIGIFSLLTEYFEMGVNYFLYLVSLISVALALANILPIPALDGGKFLFLAIEAVRKKPISPKFEERISTFFFILLISLLVYITARFDIPRLF
jgi:regulator of sigma E protease